MSAPDMAFPMDVLELAVFSWALEIKMLECQGIRAQNAAFSRAKGLNMLEFTAFSWVLELIILEFAANAGIYSIFMGAGAHCKALAHFCASGPSHWKPPPPPQQAHA